MRTVRSIALAAVVVGACGPPGSSRCLGPAAVNFSMPSLDILVGDSVETHLAEAPYFDHTCHGYELSYAAKSAEPAAVAVSVSDAVLTTIAIAEADSVRVTVTATDTSDSSAVHDFHVWVRPPLAGR